jgi:hypothetical protein
MALVWKLCFVAWQRRVVVTFREATVLRTSTPWTPAVGLCKIRGTWCPFQWTLLIFYMHTWLILVVNLKSLWLRTLCRYTFIYLCQYQVRVLILCGLCKYASQIPLCVLQIDFWPENVAVICTALNMSMKSQGWIATSNSAICTQSDFPFQFSYSYL